MLRVRLFAVIEVNQLKETRISFGFTGYVYSELRNQRIFFLIWNVPTTVCATLMGKIDWYIAILKYPQRNGCVTKETGTFVTWRRWLVAARNCPRGNQNTRLPFCPFSPNFGRALRFGAGRISTPFSGSCAEFRLCRRPCCRRETFDPWLIYFSNSPPLKVSFLHDGTLLKILVARKRCFSLSRLLCMPRMHEFFLFFSRVSLCTAMIAMSHENFLGRVGKNNQILKAAL